MSYPDAKPRFSAYFWYILPNHLGYAGACWCVPCTCRSVLDSRKTVPQHPGHPTPLSPAYLKNRGRALRQCPRISWKSGDLIPISVNVAARTRGHPKDTCACQCNRSARHCTMLFEEQEEFSHPVELDHFMPRERGDILPLLRQCCTPHLQPISRPSGWIWCIGQIWLLHPTQAGELSVTEESALEFNVFTS